MPQRQRRKPPKDERERKETALEAMFEQQFPLIIFNLVEFNAEHPADMPVFAFSLEVFSVC